MPRVRHTEPKISDARINQGSGGGKTSAGDGGVSSDDFVISFCIDAYYRCSNYKLSLLILFNSIHQILQTNITRTIHQYLSVINTIITPNIH